MSEILGLHFAQNKFVPTESDVALLTVGNRLVGKSYGEANNVGDTSAAPCGHMLLTRTFIRLRYERDY